MQTRMIRKTFIWITCFSTNAILPESFAPMTARTRVKVPTRNDHWTIGAPKATPLSPSNSSSGRRLPMMHHKRFPFRFENTVGNLHRRTKRFLLGLMIGGALLLGWKAPSAHAATKTTTNVNTNKQQLPSETDSVQSTKLSTSQEILLWTLASGGTFALVRNRKRNRNRNNDNSNHDENRESNEKNLGTMKMERMKKLELQKEIMNQESLSLQRLEPPKPSSNLEDIQALEMNNYDDTLEDDDEEFAARIQALSNNVPTKSGTEVEQEEELRDKSIQYEKNETEVSKQDKNGTPMTCTSEEIAFVEQDSESDNESFAGGVFDNKEEVQKELGRVMSITKEWEFLQEPAANTAFPLRKENFIKARRQPKSREEQEKLALKYGKIDDVSERAFQVLKDLGMVEESNPVEMKKFEGIIDMQRDKNED